MSSGPRIDKDYIRTQSGILKVAQIIVSLLGFICSASSWRSYYAAAGWFEFVSFTAFIITLILLIFYVLRIIAMGRPLSNLPWYMIEFMYCAIWAFFFLIASLVLALKLGRARALAAAAFFGFLAMVLYAYDAFLKLRLWKSGEVPAAISNARSGPTTTSSVTLPP